MSGAALARRSLLLALGAAGWPLAGWPQPGAGTPGVELPPAPLPPRPLRLPALRQQRLANGVTLLTASRHDLPLVSAMLLLRVGAEADPPVKPGVAAMTATLLAKGAHRGGRAGHAVGAAALAQQAEALGGVLDTGSGWRRSSAAITVTTPQLPAALALLADVVRRPLLAADELSRARAQALDAWRLTLGSPSEVAAMALRRTFWGDTAYGAVAGAAALQRIGHADIVQFHRLRYRPVDAALVLAGDIDAEAALALADRLLGDWSPAPAPLSAAPPAAAEADAALPMAAPLLLVDMPGSGQSAVALAAPFVGDSDPADRAALAVGQVANAVLGGGYSARLNQQVRIRRGLSYGAFSSVESYPPGGMLGAAAQTHHADAMDVLALMRAELLRLAEAPPPAAELAARQATLTGSFARQLDTVGGLAALVAGQWVHGRAIDELLHYADRVRAVTAAEVQGFARSHWSADRLRAVVAGDLAAAGAALPAAGPGALRLSVTDIDFDRLGRRP